MNAATQQFIDEVNNCALLSEISPERIKVRFPKLSFDLWMKGAKYRKWNKLTLAWQNDLTGWLAVHHRDEFSKWNELVLEARLPIKESMKCAIQELTLDDRKLIELIKGGMQWGLVSIAMEYQYSYLNPPTHFIALRDIYLSGHFPCGWIGGMPKKHPFPPIFPEGEVIYV